ncbi:hypothetical protein ACFOQM_12515 [Paenibacillus sp. GCM10012307]|uniref:Uncharacterized protein n=1 Tax=Paenibacillus roseus TaxID=2798579 RepID=A0A934J3H0_9BACL|nr:hypothetical protein [Paenibacillus roseus]MBJ6362115.1 hypothetical protein [Paenibacillus roseus]
MKELRCNKCKKKLGMILGAFSIQCPKCDELNESMLLDNEELAELIAFHLPLSSEKAFDFVNKITDGKEMTLK